MLKYDARSYARIGIFLKRNGSNDDWHSCRKYMASCNEEGERLTSSFFLFDDCDFHKCSGILCFLYLAVFFSKRMMYEYR